VPNTGIAAPRCVDALAAQAFEALVDPDRVLVGAARSTIIARSGQTTAAITTEALIRIGDLLAILDEFLRSDHIPELLAAHLHATGRDHPRHWLSVFVQRFYSFSQFKRSALPNGPKVSHGGSLSPRGDWRVPSDLSARTWLDEIGRNVPED
jgi:hypothetical protein